MQWQRLKLIEDAPDLTSSASCTQLDTLSGKQIDSKLNAKDTYPGSKLRQQINKSSSLCVSNCYCSKVDSSRVVTSTKCSVYTLAPTFPFIGAIIHVLEIKINIYIYIILKAEA